MFFNLVNLIRFSAATRACFAATKSQEVEMTLKGWLRNHNRYNKAVELEDGAAGNEKDDDDAQRECESDE